MSYLDACRRVLDAVTDAEADVAACQDNPVGTLTISAPVLFGQRFIAPLIDAYAQRYPDVSINAVYVDRTTRLLEEGVDVAIRIGHRAIRRSMPFRWVLYGVEPTRLRLISRRTGNPFIPGSLPIITACPSRA